MCGIAGFTTGRGRVRADVMRSALAAIHHRGPDQHGFYSDESICLGATRLKILDLSQGDQPLHSDDGDLVVVFNGEISNFVELKRRLGALGHRFRTQCDTEVVLHAFQQWDTDCFRQFRGMFAVAIWSRSRRRLLMARDPMGIKPLYYHARGGELYFGSELKCILVHPEVERTISHEGLDQYLRLNYVPGPFTLLDGIVKLPPGHLLEWRDGEAIESAFYTLPEQVPVHKSEGEACEELDELLTASLKEHLISDVPLGVWLSGGTDSATILHYASQISATPLHTLSITFRGRSFDESSRIREISRRYGTRHSEFDLNAECELASVVESLAYFSDEPSADAGAVPLWFLSRMTRPTATVVLSGEGADELFGGYITYKANRYAQTARRIPRALLRTAARAADLLPASDDKISFEYKLKRFLRGASIPAGDAHVFWNGTFSRQEKERLTTFSALDSLAPLLAPMSAAPGLSSALDYDQRYYLPDDILYKVDRVSMAHSVEVRPPFLDLRLVEFARRLPESFILRGGTSKYILRRLMRDKLPRSVVQGPKVGLDIPVHEWLRGPLRPMMLDTISENAVRSSDLFHWKAVERVINQHLTRKANWGYHLWGLMTLLVWMKRWNVQTGRTAAQPSQADVNAVICQA